MKENFEFLAEKEEMWAQMLLQVLKDNGIPCAVLPVHGAAMVMKAGMQERLQLYVPSTERARATQLLEALFPADGAEI